MSCCGGDVVCAGTLRCRMPVHDLLLLLMAWLYELERVTSDIPVLLVLLRVTS